MKNIETIITQTIDEVEKDCALRRDNQLKVILAFMRQLKKENFCIVQKIELP